jgi:hypothetical protein
VFVFVVEVGPLLVCPSALSLQFFQSPCSH